MRSLPPRLRIRRPRLRLYKMRAWLLLAATAILFGASATVPQIYVATALPGATGLKTETIVIDPPLTLTRDASGRLHLGATPQPAFCSSDSNGNSFCQVTAGVIPSAPVPVLMAYNEFPVYDATAKQWTLVHTPLTGLGLSCWIGNTLQQGGTIYTLAANVLTSAIWQPTDPVMCQYSYAP